MTTPMMQQYREAKERHPGMLLLFRAGDFYELFFDDAELASRMLGITLTSRDKQAPMAGFPHHALEIHLRKLLQAGHRVAICDQVEDAAQAKGRLIRREVTRVVTPGTLTDDGLLDPKSANHLVALAPIRGRYPRIGLAWVELSTGLFQAADVERGRMADELDRLAPSELVVGEMASVAEAAPILSRLQESLGPFTITTRPDWIFDNVTAREALYAHFGVRTLAGFGFDDEQPCIPAAGALLQYVKETLKTELTHLSRLRPYSESKHLFLDEVTRRGLELVRNQRDGGRQGTLLAVMDRTVTSMGARLLMDWLLSPLRESSAIEARLEAVGELHDEHSLRGELREHLAGAYDLQRLTARCSTGRATPRDLAAVARTLALLPAIRARIAGRSSVLLRELEQRLDACPDLRELLEGAIVADPPLSAEEGGIIARGYDADLDELHEIASGGKDWMVRYQADEARRTGIPSLKVGYNQVFGYYIEITHANSTRVPADYVRKQTLKNAERYITPELKEHEEKVLTATEKINAREYELFVSLRDQVSARTLQLMQSAESVAMLDVLAGLAELAAERGHCRPRLSEESILEIKDGRHPVLEQTLPPGTFVPNDTLLGGEAGKFLLITGPNMGGKSTFLRQTALITLMAQMGSFVPAKMVHVGIVDRIFTRVGARDDLSRSQSTFMVEMTEAANILNNATAKSLVILDEIGRGTSTYDGVSLAWGITEHLHDRIGCLTLFATHYHELAELEERLAGLRNYNVRVRETDEGIVFLHKIARGSADKSYGIHVAQRAGVPEPVLQRARAVLAELEAHHLQQEARPAKYVSRPKLLQASLFSGTDDPVLVALRECDLEATSPEELLTIVRRWQKSYADKSKVNLDLACDLQGATA